MISQGQQLQAAAAEAAKRAAYFAGQADALAQVAQRFGGQVVAGGQEVQSTERVFGFAQALKEEA